MIANAGSDEWKKYIGGKAGDQTHKEYAVVPWYSRPWMCVLRYPSARAGTEIAALAKAAAMNDHIGYDQGQRLTFYYELKAANWDPAAIKKDCETDCSGSAAAVIIAAGQRLGIDELKKVNPSLTTSVMRKALCQAGFDVLTGRRYLLSDAYLMPGDVLLYDGHHVAVNLEMGAEASRAAKDRTQQLAREVLQGKWGSGRTRQRALTEAGYDYEAIQEEVNRIVRSGT